MKCPHTNNAFECVNGWCRLNATCMFATPRTSPPLPKRLVITIKDDGWTMEGYAPCYITMERAADGTTTITFSTNP